jgi:quinol monooxygenase YgiN
MLAFGLAVAPALAQDHMHETMMDNKESASGEVSVVVHHAVADFDKWLPAFESHASVREAAGCMGISAYRDASDPTKVTIIAKMASLEQAQAFAASEDLKKAMEEAGVTGPPDMHFLHHFKDYAH